MKQKECCLFPYCVFKVSINTKKWLRAALIRAIRTMAQTFIASVGSAAALGAVDWRLVLSASVLAGIVSVVTSVAGIPEAAEQD